jgi:hypothetical protein
MRDGVRRDVERAKAERLQRLRQERLAKVAVIVRLAELGQMAIGRALDEIIETARGDADTVVRVGHEVRPDLQTGEQR